MRRAKPEKRELLPDIRFNSITVQTMVKHVLKNGKKSTAIRLIYDAMDLIKERTEKDPMEVFDGALKNVGPAMEVRPRAWAVQPIRFPWKFPLTAALLWRSVGFLPQPAIVPANPFPTSLHLS
jgi:small subunit ribosomal protein S7